MSKILVFGHQNPDSDAIGSSVAFAYLAKEAYGLDTEAVVLELQMKKQLSYWIILVWKLHALSHLLKAEGAEQVILTEQ